MAKKTTTPEVEETAEERNARRLEVAENFQAFITSHAGDPVIAEFAATWKGAYLTVGHKALGRMLLGQDPAKALRIEG